MEHWILYLTLVATQIPWKEVAVSILLTYRQNEKLFLQISRRFELGLADCTAQVRQIHDGGHIPRFIYGMIWRNLHSLTGYQITPFTSLIVYYSFDRKNIPVYDIITQVSYTVIQLYVIYMTRTRMPLCATKQTFSYFATKATKSRMATAGDGTL